LNASSADAFLEVAQRRAEVVVDLAVAIVVFAVAKFGSGLGGTARFPLALFAKRDTARTSAVLGTGLGLTIKARRQDIGGWFGVTGI